MRCIDKLVCFLASTMFGVILATTINIVRADGYHRYREEPLAYEEPRRYRQHYYNYRPHYHRYRHFSDPHCRGEYSAVGNQHLTLDGAKKAANDAWAGTIRFKIGEIYMDLANAVNINYTCSRSSITEGSVATLGQTLTRCEVNAQPCKPQREWER